MKNLKKFIVLVSIFASAFVGCKKETYFFSFTPFRNKYLVCDSMRITDNGNDKLVVLGRGKGFDAEFDNNNRRYTIFSTPIQQFGYTDDITIYKYKDQQYAKIYFWEIGKDIHSGDYLIIENVVNNHVTLLHKDLLTKQQVRYYYTAD